MKFFGLLLTLLISFSVYTQTYEWAHSTGSAQYDVARNITTDKFGNLLVIGDYGTPTGGVIDLNPGPGDVNYTSNGGSDVFIQKFTPDGTLIWAKSFGGTSNDRGYCITSDEMGNIYVSGWFINIVDFDPGLDISNLISNGSADIYILKLSINGEFIWVKQIGGVSNEAVLSMDVDESNNLVLVGYFNDTVDFDPGVGTDIQTSNGLKDIFIQKIDTSGTHLWVETFGGSGVDDAESVFTDQNMNIYVTGGFEDTIDFDSGVGIDQHVVIGLMDYYALKLDENGVHQWAKSFGGSDFEDCYSVCVDNDENVYLTGLFKSTMDFDPGSGVMNHTPNGADDAFIHKLDGDGNLIWVRTFGGISSDIGSSIKCDQEGGVYVGGSFQASVDFNPLGVGNVVTSAGHYDIYIQKIDSSGNFLWVQTFGEIESDRALSISLGNNFSLYVVGYYNQTVDFDPGSGVNNLTSNGFFDSYILKFGQCIKSSSINDTTVCLEYISPSGNYLWTQTGNYLDTLPNLNYCGLDSIIYINLTVNEVDISVSQLDDLTLESNSASGSYIWVDCNDGYSVLNGETNQSYTAIENGSYAVTVTENNCIDTSACFVINEVGMDELFSTSKQLLKIVDLMGRETPYKPNTVLIYVYDDGSTEKVFKMEE